MRKNFEFQGRTVLLALLSWAFIGCQPQSASESAIKADQSSQIINGRPVAKQDSFWKYTVSVGPAEEPQCTGVLIGENHILTAAHCVEAIENTYVHFGLDFSAHDCARLRIKKVIAHPEYCDDCTGGLTLGATNDIAIVEFEGVPPQGFEIAQIAEKSELSPGQKVFLAGFGANEHGNYETIMKVTEVPLNTVSESEFSTDESAAGSCNGDSGGPAFIEVNGKLKVAGLTSRGDARCRKMGIYTIPHFFEMWILDVLTTPSI